MDAKEVAPERQDDHNLVVKVGGKGESVWSFRLESLLREAYHHRCVLASFQETGWFLH